MDTTLQSNNNYPKYRWVILSLLFTATTINYFDRIILSILYPEIKDILGISKIDYTHINTAFRVMYMLGFLVVGKTIDRMGTRNGYWLSIICWSIVAALTSLIRSAFSLGFWRGLLGLTESANFHAAMKSVSEWFPPKQRSLATSLFNSGPSIAPIVGPPMIAAIYLWAGWRWAFFIVASFGLVLAVIWPFLYRRPKHKC